MATSMGTVKKTPLTEFSNPRKAGIIAVGLDEGDYLIGAALTDGKHDVMLFSDGGKAVRFDENDVRPMGRNARGVRGMMLEERPERDRHAGGRGRAKKRADRHRKRLRQAHGHQRIHPPRPRHQGHDRHPAVRAQRQGRGRHPGGAEDEIMLITDKACWCAPASESASWAAPRRA
jgi:DNA gyrase subunit A